MDGATLLVTKCDEQGQSSPDIVDGLPLPQIILRKAGKVSSSAPDQAVGAQPSNAYEDISREIPQNLQTHPSLIYESSHLLSNQTEPSYEIENLSLSDLRSQSQEVLLKIQPTASPKTVSIAESDRSPIPNIQVHYNYELYTPHTDAESTSDHPDGTTVKCILYAGF